MARLLIGRIANTDRIILALASFASCFAGPIWKLALDRDEESCLMRPSFRVIITACVSKPNYYLQKAVVLIYCTCILRNVHEYYGQS